MAENKTAAEAAEKQNAGVERPTIADDAPSAKALEKATSKLRQAMRDDLKIKA